MIVVTDQFLLLIAKWFGTKMGHTNLCIGLQGFVCLWSATCFYDKKLAQEDKKLPCANALLQVTNVV
ncbi:hypothetical protein BU777_22935 [Salmonella enterica]|nr:hypothetical protein [Salmonella enterica]